MAATMQVGEVVGREISITNVEGIGQLLQYRQAEVDALKVKLATIEAETHRQSAEADQQAADLESAIASKHRELAVHGNATDAAVKRMGDIETQILDAQHRTSNAACQMEADTIELQALCQRRALASVNFKSEQALRGLATDLNAKLVQAQRTGRFLTMQLQTRLQELRALRDVGNEEATLSLELHEEQLRHHSITQEVQALEGQEQSLIQELREKIKQEATASSQQSSKPPAASNKESLEAQIEAAKQEEAELSRESFRYAQKCLELEAQLGEQQHLSSTKRLNKSQLLDEQDWAAPAVALASSTPADVLDCGTPDNAQSCVATISKISAVPTQTKPAEAQATSMGHVGMNGRPAGHQPSPSPRMPLFQMVGGQFMSTNAVPAAPIKTSSLVSAASAAATPSVAAPASAATMPSVGADAIAPSTATLCQSTAAPVDAAMSVGTAPHAAPPVAASRYLTAEERAAMTPDTAMVAAAPVAVSAVGSAEERPMEGAIPLLPGVMAGNAASAVSSGSGRQSTGPVQSRSADPPVARSSSVGLAGSDLQQQLQTSTTLVPTVTVSGFSQPATQSDSTQHGDPFDSVYFTGREPDDFPPIVPEDWHFEQSCKMSEKLDLQKLVGKVRLLDGAVVNSVGKAIEGLNSGSLECPEGFCLIWSLSSQCWFLLWRAGRQEAALSTVGLAEVEEPPAHTDSSIDCQLQDQSPPAQTFVEVIGGFGTAVTPGTDGMSSTGQNECPDDGNMRVTVETLPGNDITFVSVPPNRGMEPDLKVQQNINSLGLPPTSSAYGLPPTSSAYGFPPTSSAYAMDGGSTYQGSAISTASGSGTLSTGYVVPSTSSTFSVQQNPFSSLRTQYGVSPDMLLRGGGASGAYPTLSGPPARSGSLSFSVQSRQPTTYAVGIGDTAVGYGTSLISNPHSVMRFESAPSVASYPLASSRVRRSSYGYAPSVSTGLEAVTEHFSNSFPPDAFRSERRSSSAFASDTFRPETHHTSAFSSEAYRSDMISAAASTVVDSLRAGRTPLASSRITQANVGDRDRDRNAFGSGRFAR